MLSILSLLSRKSGTGSAVPSRGTREAGRARGQWCLSFDFRHVGWSLGSMERLSRETPTIMNSSGSLPVFSNECVSPS